MNTKKTILKLGSCHIILIQKSIASLKFIKTTRKTSQKLDLFFKKIRVFLSAVTPDIRYFSAD